MDAKKFLEIQRKHKLATFGSQPLVQPQPNQELEARPLLKPELVVRPPQQLDSVVQTKLKPDPELQLLLEPVEHLESLATTARQESIFALGWEYSQLLKEFR